LEANKPAKIAVNIDSELAFGSGLHAGELVLIKKELGKNWAEKFVNLPLLAIEYVGTMPRAQLEWYKKLQGTAWAMISEAFSEKVIAPGETSTEVCICPVHSSFHCSLSVEVFLSSSHYKPGR
jgi:hypothetical protein